MEQRSCKQKNCGKGTNSGKDLKSEGSAGAE